MGTAPPPGHALLHCNAALGSPNQLLPTQLRTGALGYMQPEQVENLITNGSP